MSKQYFADIDDIADNYVIPALGEYADDFDCYSISYFVYSKREPDGLCVDTDEFGNVLTPDGKRVSFWDIARRFALPFED